MSLLKRRIGGTTQQQTNISQLQPLSLSLSLSLAFFAIILLSLKEMPLITEPRRWPPTITSLSRDMGPSILPVLFQHRYQKENKKISVRRWQGEKTRKESNNGQVRQHPDT